MKSSNQSKLPNQAAPVKRTTVGVLQNNEQPFSVLNFNPLNKQEKLNFTYDLLHGANYNVPAKFLLTSNSSGCHIFSESSMAICLASIGLI